MSAADVATWDGAVMLQVSGSWVMRSYPRKLKPTAVEGDDGRQVFTLALDVSEEELAALEVEAVTLRDLMDVAGVLV